MGTFDRRMQKTATRLIGKGATITLTHVVPGVYDPGELRNLPGTTTNTMMAAVITKATLKTYPDGSNVQSQDRAFLVSGVVTAQVGDTITHQGDTFMIGDIADTYSGDLRVTRLLTGKHQ